MSLQITGEVMVFTKDYDWGRTYSIGISKKNEDGKYDKAYFQAKFKKGVVLENMTKIDIKNGWFSFDIPKDDPKKRYLYIFVSEFESDAVQEDVPQGFSQVEDSDFTPF